MTETRFARYLKTGDVVWHSTRKMWVRLIEVNVVRTDVGDVVGGWARSLKDEAPISYGIALGRADTLTIVRN